LLLPRSIRIREIHPRPKSSDIGLLRSRIEKLYSLPPHI
jgi:hypothetical protein